MSVDVDSFDGTNDMQRCNIQRARKEHVCSACGEAIRRGDLYSYSYFVYDGSGSTVKRCARCEILYRELSDRLDSYSVCDERLDCGHTYEDNFNEPPPEELARLAFVTPAEAQGLLTMSLASESAPPKGEE